jgi:hypothetical protein
MTNSPSSGLMGGTLFIFSIIVSLINIVFFNTENPVFLCHISVFCDVYKV